MVYIQSATAEIRRGNKKRRRKKKPQGKNIMSTSAMQGGHNNRQKIQLIFARQILQTAQVNKVYP